MSLGGQYIKRDTLEIPMEKRRSTQQAQPSWGTPWNEEKFKTYITYTQCFKIDSAKTTKSILCPRAKIELSVDI